MKTKKIDPFSVILILAGLVAYYYAVDTLNIIHLATFLGDWIVK